MKKYAILTSIFVLAACHDGGGHHHSDYVPEPNAPAIDMPGVVQKWNSNPGVSVVNAGRNDAFVFTVDSNGDIANISHDGKTYNRDGNKNEYVYTETNKTEKMNLATLGREAGLQFADFGYAMETEQEPAKTDRDFYVFTGGRADRVVDADLAKGATYEGTAVAYIEADMPDRIANQVSKTDDAKLVVDASGNHTLTMNFATADKPWYNVTAHKDGTINLSGGENVAADFRVDNMTMHDNYATGRFFGDGGTASEATYRAGAEFKDNATGREVEFDSAFGGKRL